jgi:hypothetical protein
MKPTNPVLLTITAVLFCSPAFANDMHGAMNRIPHTTITFGAGSAMLTENDKADLKKLVQDAESRGEIDQVTVAAWSDKALPMKGQKLADADRDLASQRASAISDYLKSATDVGDVDSYNMAENSNWLARTFNTKGSELKSVFSKKGAKNPVSNAEFRLIKQEGGSNEAVVITEMKK